MTGVFASGLDVFIPLLLVERLVVVADFPRSELPIVEEVLKKTKAKSSLTPKATQKQIKDEVQKIDFETPLPAMSGVTS